MEQNNQQSGQKSKLAMLVAVSLMWFGFSLLMPFIGIDLGYQQVLLEERIANRGVLGNDVADLVVNVHANLSALVYDSKVWRELEYRMLSGSSVVVHNSYSVVAAHVNLLLYRISALLTLFIVLLPFFIASIIDAYYFRERGKWTYFLPSPTRHRYGQLFAMWSMFASIFLFLALPFVIIPITFVALGLSSGMFGLWMWIANTQKRI
jgi:hypothetical protein